MPLTLSAAKVAVSSGPALLGETQRGLCAWSMQVHHLPSSLEVKERKLFSLYHLFSHKIKKIQGLRIGSTARRPCGEL